MNAPLVKIKNIFNEIVAISLAVWLSGLICVFGCEMAVAKSERTQANTGSMPADHSHCKRAKNKKDVKPVGEFPNPSTNESNCPFIHQPTEQASKANTQEAQPALLATDNIWVVQSSEKLQTSFSYRIRLPDRGGTHLQNCVFRI